MPTLTRVDNLVIRARLKAASEAQGRPLWVACMWGDDGTVLPKEDGVGQADYDAAAAIVAATVAEGPHRYKTPQEFWTAFAALPVEAQQAVSMWTTVLLFRETAIGNAGLADEIMRSAAWQLSQTAPEVYAQLASEGRLTFNAITAD